jgi:hypothetical protein
MDRTDWQQLADERAHDAGALLAAARWSGAYYLAGYAVECGLKACIAKLTKLHDYPDKDFVNKCYTHRIETLLTLTGLETQRTADVAANAGLGSSWLIVKDWTELARYQQWTELEARKLHHAVTDAQEGVLPWIKVHW